MGLAACFGGPVFNTLIGIGIGFTAQSERSGFHKTQASFDEKGILCMCFLLISLVSSLICFPLMHFRATREYGIYLLSLYGLFFVTSILNEVHVFHIPGTDET
ncbi:mitochondrial sodium/calcium exchanger protein-like [Schistocerca serialis cubense]|uniref:mitochondrial sodium/calcium exchanger protein-like n=1 Tax=Schistocerca serialis cubense TaxID=2023355 RepID=UPI00214F5BD1|nr:mitochondrial sodium/calcium exchanger protein-like [Schistocerca serialis cubense]